MLGRGGIIRLMGGGGKGKERVGGEERCMTERRYMRGIPLGEGPSYDSQGW